MITLRPDQVKITQTNDGRYQLSYLDPNTLQRTRRSFRTKQEAEQAKTHLLATTEPPPPTTQYVGHLMQHFLQTHPFSDVTKRRNSFLNFCDTFNRSTVDDLTEDNLRHWFLDLKAQNRYANKTLQCIKTNLNHFFKWLVHTKHLPDNPLLPIQFKTTPRTKRPRIILSEHEVQTMLEQMKQHSPTIVFPFIYTLVHTGARKNEIRQLRWTDIDFDNASLDIYASKTNTRRRIPMSPQLWTMFYQMEQRSEWVFLNKKGALLSASQIDETIEILQRKHPGGKRWRCHSLRHSFSYNFLKQGGKMYQLQALLGHKSIQMTIDLYGNLSAEDVVQVSPYSF